ncbi:MAG: hypothetical protein ACUVWX_11075 [Kiritimatiellia bacterium]
MKRKILTLGSLVVIGAGMAEARLREIPDECQNRYGPAITNYRGCRDLQKVAVYGKDAIYVTAFFASDCDQVPRASMAYYSPLNPCVDGFLRSLFATADITEKEQTALLGIVSGRWERFDSKPGLAGKPANVKTLSTQPSITVKRRDKTVKVARKAIVAVYDCSVLPSDVKNIAHVGPEVFASRIANSVPICATTGAETTEVRAGRIICDRAAAGRPLQVGPVIPWGRHSSIQSSWTH